MKLFLYFIIIYTTFINLYAETISISDANVTEGNSGTSTLVFTVTTDGNVTAVDYTTNDGTAKASDSDYVTKSDTLYFSSLSDTKTISIIVNGDTKIERDQNLTVVLSNPQGTTPITITKDTGVGIILNDDTLAGPQLSILENSADLNISTDGTISISGPDASLFTSTGGTLKFKQAPDYEHPNDADTNNVYDINLTISDSFGTLASSIENITVYDVQSDLAITQTDSIDPVVVGQTFDYILSAKNNGPDTVYNIVIKDTLPLGATYQGASGTNWTCSFASGVVTCNYNNSLVANEFAPNLIITIDAPDTHQAADTPITNHVEIDSTTHSDNTLGNNIADEVTTVKSNATDMAISMTASPSPDVVESDTITYTYQVTNNGPNTTTSVTFKDTMPTDLNFVNIDFNSTVWSCSTGSIVICDYIANGGLFTVSTTPPAVTVTMRAPAYTTTITNSVDVFAQNADSDTSNNANSVTTNVIAGTITGNEENFTKYLQYNLFGNITMLHNVNINKPPGDADKNYNDNINMTYIDIDNDSSTFNSSSQELDLNSSYRIKWAGLYWQGRAQNNNKNNPDRWKNSSYKNYKNAKQHMQEIKLKTPHTSNYITITANKLNYIDRLDKNGNPIKNTVYGAFKDITQLVTNNGTNNSAAYADGTYTVANVVSCEGTGGGGNYGGWVLFVIYEDPSATLPFKNVSVFNGFVYVNDIDNPTPITINGFVTPNTGTVTSNIAYFGADGDPVDGGSAQTQVANSGSYNFINGDTNLLNSESYNNPGVRTYGLDADLVDVSNYIINKQSSATFKFDAGYYYKYQGNTYAQLDYYTLNMFSFITDMYTPIINDMNKSATLNGQQVGVGTPLKEGDVLTYNIHFDNHGTGEVAQEVEIFDDFNQDNLNTIFDVDHFDASSIKLSKLGGSTNGWDSNADCEYDNSQHKVWCKIPEIKFGEEYDMQFNVTLLSGPVQDTNVTNTAYAKYKNATTGSYMELVQAPDGRWYGGKSNAFTAGQIKAGSTPPPEPKLVDVIEHNNYQNAGSYQNADKNITTKVVQKPFSLELIYLDHQDNETPYNGSAHNLSLSLFLYLTNNACSTTNELLWEGALPNGYSHKELLIDNNTYGVDHGEMIQKAFKDKRIKVSFVDYAKAIEENGLQCHVSSQTSSLCMVPGCLSGQNMMTKAFPPEQYPGILTCIYGDGNGLAPCDTHAYYGNCGGKKATVSPTKYNNNLGCAMCIADAIYQTTCSTDDFAVRPDAFTITSSDNDMPDLLHAAKKYNVNIKAYNYASTTPTQDYNQSSGNIEVSSIKWLNTTPKRLNGTTATLPYTGEPTLDDFNISNGVANVNGAIGEVIKMAYDDIGLITLKVKDTHWAAVDADDTPQDCSPNGAYICGDKNATFIPDHFSIKNLRITNTDNAGVEGTFTYLKQCDDANITSFRDMSARIEILISAENEKNVTTLNFTSGDGFYENPLSVDFNVSDVLHGDSNHTTISNQLLGFGQNFGLPNGTRILFWNDNNLSKSLRFNFNREVNNGINPFEINASNIAKIDVNTTYIGTAPSSPVNIGGTKNDGLGNGVVTFMYGRTHAPRQTIEGTDGNVSIFIEVFCAETDIFGIDCNKSLLSNGINSNISDDPRWFINTNHTQISYGTIGTVRQKSTNPHVTNNPLNTFFLNNGTATVPLQYDGNSGYPYKATMENNASGWLIYNKYDANATENEFEVEFVKGGAWAGRHDTNTTTENNASNKTNRRIMW